MKQTLPLKYWADDDLAQQGVEVNPALVLAATKTFWLDARNKGALGKKLVNKLDPSQLWRRAEYEEYQRHYVEQPPDWRHGTLVGVTPKFVGVKDLYSQPLNRYVGKPRQSSIVTVREKFKGVPIGMLDGTKISNARTALYATTGIDYFFRNETGIQVFLFGAGPVAEQIILFLDHHAHDKVARIVVRSRSESSSRDLVNKLQAKTRIKLRATTDNNLVPQADFVITAVNGNSSPVLKREELAPGAVTLSLSYNEMPLDYIEDVLEHGVVVCDDMNSVNDRNRQSLALHYSKRGMSLAKDGAEDGVKNIANVDPIDRDRQMPIHMACSGLAALDVYVAGHVFETLAERMGMTI